MKKLIGFIILALLCRWVFAITYMGKSNNGTTYYICENNSEVADVLGYNADSFDLSECTVKVCKAEKRTENTGLYVVMINKDDTYIVCYRAEDYDIYFYSKE